MAVLNNTGILAGASGAAGGGGGYEIEKSCRFNEDDSAYLNRAPSSDGSTTTFTWSGWVKRTLANSGYTWFLSSKLSPHIELIYLNADRFEFYQNGSGGVTSEALLRDPSAWYHLVCAVDTTQDTDSDRVKLYINGEVVTDFYQTYYPSEDHVMGINKDTNDLKLGKYTTTCRSNYQLAEVHYIDGEQLTASDFGETNATTGQWIPKDCSEDLTYGTNGFYLKFNGTDLGEDSSGNDNDWTANNLTANQLTTVGAATGGLPFYNTSGDQGGTKVSGYRTDSSAGTTDGTGLVFAMPGDVLTDEHDEVNTGSSANTMSALSTGPTASTDKSRYYGTSLKFTGNGGIKSGSIGDLAFGTGDYTIECWFYATSSSTGYLWDFRTNTAASATYVYYGSAKLYFPLAGLQVDSGVSLNEWHHVAAVRDSGTTKVYVDGVEKSSAAETTDFSSATSGVTLGCRYTNGSYYTGYIQDFRVYKGVAKYSSAFSIAQGESTEIDVLTDTPTNYGDDTGVGGAVRGNYCTMNPLHATATLQNGNLDIVPLSGHSNNYGTLGMSSGKWYWEVHRSYFDGNSGSLGFHGSASANKKRGTSWPQPAANADQHVFYINAGLAGILYNGQSGASFSFTGSSTPTLPTDWNKAAGYWMFCVDMDNQKAWIGKDGVWWGWNGTAYTTTGGDPANGTNPTFVLDANDTYFPFNGTYGSTPTDYTYTHNFGQRAFAYTAPSGYKCLCTQNLDDTEILSGEYEGNADADGPFVWMNAVPATLKIGTSDPPTTLVTFDSAVVDPLSNGFKIRHASTNNASGTTYYWLATSDTDFKDANAQTNE